MNVYRDARIPRKLPCPKNSCLHTCLVSSSSIESCRFFTFVCSVIWCNLLGFKDESLYIFCPLVYIFSWAWIRLWNESLQFKFILIFCNRTSCSMIHSIVKISRIPQYSWLQLNWYLRHSFFLLLYEQSNSSCWK